MPSVFDYLNDISRDKSGIFDANDCKDYNQYMVNRGLMQHRDTVLLANEMNKRRIPDLLHYDFLFNSVEPRKRYGKWVKADEEEYAELIGFLQSHFNVNRETALQYLSLLDTDERNGFLDMKKKLEYKGGKK